MARLITLSDRSAEMALEIQQAIFRHTGSAHRVGITGPAGAGKSTLIARLAAELSANGQKTAVVACDPSSPKSGGALLGDRIRMHNLVHDENVFIRSIATGSSVNGLPLAAFRVADILDACGYSMVIIETVGTGQNQVDIMQAAHTVIAVSAPGLGDDIQAMKSGLLEIADIHAVTKNDFNGSDKTLMEIGNAVHMRQNNHAQHESGKGWSAPVLSLNGLSGDGMADLQRAIAAHHAYLMKDNNLQKRCRHMFQQRIFREAVDLLSQSFANLPDASFSKSLEQVMKRDLTPTEAAIRALNKLK